MFRYLKLFGIFFTNSLARETEFRANFLILIAIDLIWVCFQVITIELFFSFSGTISGWSRHETYAFIGIFRMVKGLFDVFCRKNLHYFPESVSRGELDYSLTRPINSLFIMSTRYHAVSELTSFILGLVLFILALPHLTSFPSVSALLTMPVLVLSGVLVFYCLILLVATLSIFTVRLTALGSYYDVFSQSLRFPTDIYLGHGRVVDALLLPLLLMATLPAKIILGKEPLFFVSAQLFFALLLFLLTYRFWHFALRHYSSASS